MRRAYLLELWITEHESNSTPTKRRGTSMTRLGFQEQARPPILKKRLDGSECAKYPINGQETSRLLELSDKNRKSAAVRSKKSNMIYNRYDLALLTLTIRLQTSCDIISPERDT